MSCYKLLNVDANPKTVKGRPHGYATAVLYLAPWKSAGVNVCPMAEVAGCNVSCLNTAGRGGIARATFTPHGVTLPDNAIQRARIRRTRLYVENRAQFMNDLCEEIARFVRSSRRLGLEPCVRLNGTSDILWEREADHAEFTVFDNFPDVQFYDYTKLPKRLLTRLPPNYHLTLSYSGANEAYARKVEQVADTANASVVYVLRTKHAKAEALRICGESGVDGDSHDLRFLDPPGSRVFLSAKGAAKHDRSGFVLDGWQRP